MIHDSSERYGRISKILHWSMAILIIWQLLKLADRINDGEHWVGQTLVPWHISIGTLLLLLVVVRLIWVARQRGHRPVQNPATAMLVKIGHGLLYVGMVLMPITGIMVMIGGGYGVEAFGIQLIPSGEEAAWAETLGSIHSPLAWIVTVLILGHIGMALIHHFFHRDDTLRRML